MNLVAMKIPPTMPDVPKAPRSQVTPQMELPKAPGSSLIHPSQGVSTSAGAPKITNGDAPSQLSRPASRAGSVKQIPQSNATKSNTPLPPSSASAQIGTPAFQPYTISKYASSSRRQYADAFTSDRATEDSLHGLSSRSSPATARGGQTDCHADAQACCTYACKYQEKLVPILGQR